MLLPLYILRRIVQRTLLAFVLIEGFWCLAALLQFAQREKILGIGLLVGLVPILVAYAAVPCMLAATAGGVSGALAELGHDQELTAASAAGIGPGRTLLIPVIAVGLMATPFIGVAAAELFPVARAAKHIQLRALARSPEVCVRWLGANPTWIPGLSIRMQPEEDGRFRELWAVELGDSGLPEAVWSAERGSVRIPEDRDVVRLDLEDVRLWRRTSEGVERVQAETVRMDRTIEAFLRRSAAFRSSAYRERTLAELAEWIDELPPGDARNRARAERAGRWTLILATLPVVLCAAAIGCFAARWRAWIGSIAGVLLVGLVLLPLHGICTKFVGEGAHALIFALPLAALLGIAVLFRRRTA